MSGVSITLDGALTEARLRGQVNLAQKWLDNEVLKDCAPYVPMRTGQLMKSGTLGTVIGSGEVVYNVPYARRMYYGDHLHFSRDAHPQATSQWFEKSKAVNKTKWLSGARKAAKGD